MARAAPARVLAGSVAEGGGGARGSLWSAGARGRTGGWWRRRWWRSILCVRGTPFAAVF